MRKGFTLAEVLITLGIIGVVAALILPQVVTSYEQLATEVRIKKDFSTIANALKAAEAEHGPIETWGENGSSKNYKNYFKKLEPFLQLAYPPCYDEDKCFDKRPSIWSLYRGVYFTLKDGTYGIYQGSDSYTSVTNLSHYIKFFTNSKRTIEGCTEFEYSVLNFKNLRIKSNVTCGANNDTVCYWNYKSSPPKCYGNGAAWDLYNCSIIFAHNGFKFPRDYNFKGKKYQSDAAKSVLKYKPRGWR